MLCSALLLLAFAACAGRGSLRPDVARLDDARQWSVVNAQAQPASEAGREAVQLAPVGGNRKGSNVGFALVSGARFDEGVIDVDLRGLGEGSPSFVGVAFGFTDAEHYEAIYFRPFRFRSGTKLERSHAVQYVAWPEHTWEALRERAPGVYESAIHPVPDPAGWFHARVEVSGAQVKVFVDRAPEPTLVVSRLRSDAGGVGLWVDSQPGSFANLEVSR